MVKNIFEGSSGSIPYVMQIYNNNLYFTAATFQNARELWKLNADDLSTNIETSNKWDLSIYPNPVSNILNINIVDNLIIERLIISDLSGKKVLEQSGGQTSINIKSFARGMYILEVFGGEKKETGKFLKE